jgi:hypothetical protein
MGRHVTFQAKATGRRWSKAVPAGGASGHLHHVASADDRSAFAPALAVGE